MKKIAILSGKGGAGKTFVTVNLAATAEKAVYVDCDVEEPNGQLFLHPETIAQHEVFKSLPQISQEKCSGCRKCADFCRFSALAFLKTKPLLFPELCHDCGGCQLVCPSDAISMDKRSIGTIFEGMHKNVYTVTGMMHLGEASGTKIIENAIAIGKKQAEKADALLCIDCPPGSACTVMESIADADYCILVAEPTAFGFHNFKMVHELCKVLSKPCGVVINKMDAPYLPLESYCTENEVPILLRIPYQKEITTLCASGKIAVEENREAKALFSALLHSILEVTA